MLLFYIRYFLGLINVVVDDQRLLFDGIILENAKSLSDSGITVKNAQAMSPAQLTLAVRDPSSKCASCMSHFIHNLSVGRDLSHASSRAQ